MIHICVFYVIILYELVEVNKLNKLVLLTKKKKKIEQTNNSDLFGVARLETSFSNFFISKGYFSFSRL